MFTADERTLIKRRFAVPISVRSLIYYLDEKFDRTDRRVGVEVGVERGLTSKTLLRWFPHLELTLVDTWDADNAGTTERTAEEHRLNQIETQLRVAPWLSRVRILKMDSEAASHAGLWDEMLDFAYIDADHSFEGVSRDLRVWWDRIRPGGSLTGDDYYGLADREGIWGVKSAVDQFAAQRGLEVETRTGRLFILEKPE